MRVSVSAEVYGEYNKKENFTAPVHPKSEEDLQILISLLDKNVLF